MDDKALEHHGRFSLDQLPPGSVVHFVGAGGAGMSAIATVLLQMGFKVEGSDLKESSYVRRLRDLGASVGIGHRAENVGGCKVVVRSSAIRGDNPEIIEAQRRGLPVISRAKMLAAIMETRRGIAVAGTHGKTTTSSLVTCMLAGCGADPSYLIGGELNETGSNAHYGSGEFMVAEADESDGSLLYLRPEIVVLTNVDWDHLDYFDSPEQTADVFRKFLEVIPLDGFAAICGDDPRAREVGSDYRASGGKVVFYGRGADNDYTFEITGRNAGGVSFTVSGPAGEIASMSTRLPGLHNAYNALGAITVGCELGLPVAGIASGIESCPGVRRRFEEVGERGGIKVIDDYAHHPTEVKAVMEIAANLDAERVVVVFQPHRYTRTRMLCDQFGESFEGAGLVVVADVYGAGEDPEPGVTGKLIADSILEHDPDMSVAYFESRADLARGVVGLIEPGDVVITMGAGDVTQCGREILDLLDDEG